MSIKIRSIRKLFKQACLPMLPEINMREQAIAIKAFKAGLNYDKPNAWLAIDESD